MFDETPRAAEPAEVAVTECQCGDCRHKRMMRAHHEATAAAQQSAMQAEIDAMDRMRRSYFAGQPQSMRQDYDNCTPARGQFFVNNLQPQQRNAPPPFNSFFYRNG